MVVWVPAQILFSLSERHAHLEFELSDTGDIDLMIYPLVEALFLVMDHAAHLPRMHRQHASPIDTALLMVTPSP